MAGYLLARGDAWWKARMRCLVRDNFQCQHPGCLESRLRFLHVHHIQARIDGGTHGLDNLVTLCREHHILKHPHMLFELSASTPPTLEYPWREL